MYGRRDSGGSPSNSYEGPRIATSPRNNSGGLTSPQNPNVNRVMSSKGGMQRGLSGRNTKIVGKSPIGLGSVVRGLSSRGNKHRQRQQSMRKGDDDSPPGLGSVLSGFFGGSNRDLDDDDEIAATFASVEQNEKQEKSFAEILRLRIKIFVAYSIYGRIYEWFTTLLSMISCLLYIYQTYYAESKLLELVELGTTIIFTFDFLLSVFIADHRWEHLRSFFSLVDALTVIPTWATLGTSRVLYSELDSPYNVVLYILNLFKATRVLRPLRIRRKLLEIEDEVQRALADMILRIIVMILFNTAVIQYLERQDQDYEFFIWMYFIWITTTTVGYGDISPQSIAGRVAIMYTICFSIAVIPQMTNNLLAKMAKSSVYARAVFTPKVNCRHIIICGDLSTTSLVKFFAELYHEDHESSKLTTVIVNTSFQSEDMKQVLSDPRFEMNLVYLEGTVLNDRDLRRAAADDALAILMFTNKFTLTPDRDDARILLEHHNVKRYVEERQGFDFVNREMIFCVQLIRPENQRHFSGGLNSETVTEHVICLNEIKMGIIAKSVMFPGTAALITNLLASFADEEEKVAANASEMEALDMEVEDSAGERSVSRVCLEKYKATVASIGEGRGQVQSDPNSFWVKEYEEGCEWEIYTTDISPAFEGAVFKFLAISLYRKLGIVLVGLQIEDVLDEVGPDGVLIPNYTRTVLNPAEFVFPNPNRYRIRGLVIAENKSTADLSTVDLRMTEPGALNISTPEECIPAGPASLQSPGPPSLLRHFYPPLSMGLFAASPIAGKKAAVSSPARFTEQPQTIRVQVHDEQSEASRQARKEKVVERVEKIRYSSMSYQEKLFKIEHEFLSANFYLRTVVEDELFTQADITITTSILEEIPHIHSHIIITGHGLANLYDLIKPLRSKEHGRMRYIVILYPEDIPESVWQRISIFDGLLLVKGTPMDEEDIRRAGVFRAQQVVILAGSSDDAQKEDGAEDEDQDGSDDDDDYDDYVAGSEALLDSDSIFTFKAVKRMNDSVQCVVEFVSDRNINYLNPETGAVNGIGSDFRSTPQFAAGELFVSSLLDTVVCQAFYNPHIVNIINRLVISKDPYEDAAMTNRAGTVKLRGLDSVLGSSLYQIDIPHIMQHKKYEFLFESLVEQGVIPIGLYRDVLPDVCLERHLNILPYVFTNPSGSTELFGGDKVFVLSTKPVRATNKKETEEEKEADKYMEYEIDKMLHNTKKAAKLKREEVASQRWTVFLSELEILFNDELEDDPDLLDSVIEALESCRNKIVQASSDEMALANMQSDDSSEDLDLDVSDDDSDSSMSEFTEQGGVSFTSKMMNQVMAKGGNGGAFKLPRYIEKANARVRAELDPRMRLTKFVVETFKPSINIFLNCLSERRYTVIKEQAESFAMTAQNDGCYKLACWYDILRDIVDLMIFVYTPANDVPGSKVYSNTSSQIDLFSPKSTKGQWISPNAANPRSPVSGTAPSYPGYVPHTGSGEGGLSSPKSPSHHHSVIPEPLAFSGLSDDDSPEHADQVQPFEPVDSPEAVVPLPVKYPVVNEIHMLKNRPPVSISSQILNPIRLSEKAADIISNMVDALEIAIWDAAVEEVT